MDNIHKKRCEPRFIHSRFVIIVGLPDPPNNVQVELGPQSGTLLVSWTPVTSQPLPPSRAAVHSYLIYADGRNIAQVPSANG